VRSYSDDFDDSCSAMAWESSVVPIRELVQLALKKGGPTIE